MHQLCFIRGGHHDEIGQVRQKRHVKGAGMSGPIRPDQPRAINREAHRQALDRHVMHHLIIAALQEGRIHRAERLHPARRQSGRECHTVLFRDPHVKAPAGVAFGEKVQPCPIRHRGCHGADLVVFCGLGDQAVRKDAGIAGRV